MHYLVTDYPQNVFGGTDENDGQYMEHFEGGQRNRQSAPLHLLYSDWVTQHRVYQDCVWVKTLDLGVYC